MRRPLKWYSLRWQTGVILLVGFVLLWYLWIGYFQRPVGEGPAGPPVLKSAFAHVWSKEDTVLIGLGDSITNGYGSSKGHSYFELLIKNDIKVYPGMEGCDLKIVFPNLVHINLAQDCTTSDQHLKWQVPAIELYSENIKGIVCITTGGNDIIHNYGRSAPKEGAMYGCSLQQALKWRKGFRKRLNEILDRVNEKFSGGCEIFLANIYDPTDGVGDIEHANILLPAWPDGLEVLKLWNETIAEVCRSFENVHLVDIHSAFLGHGIHCRDKDNKHYRKEDPYYWYYLNLEDPNDRGYDAIRRVFLNEMVRVLWYDSG